MCHSTGSIGDTPIGPFYMGTQLNYLSESLVMECLSYCVANSIDLSKLHNHYYAGCDAHNSQRSHDVVRLSPNKDKDNDKYIFIFKNGTVVFWGIKRFQVGAYIESIKAFSKNPIHFPVHDEFNYQITNATSIAPHGYFDVDCLYIDAADDNEELRLSFSYGFSQSVKLQYFETKLEALIDKYAPLIQSLSNQGEIAASRKHIRQIIGEILSAKSEMNLVSNFLYHPKYFWQHPTLEDHYILLEKYLHISRRVGTINHRLDTLNEIFDMFSSYLDNKHAHTLEVIIIILIAIEIIFSLLNFHF